MNCGTTTILQPAAGLLTGHIALDVTSAASRVRRPDCNICSYGSCPKAQRRKRAALVVDYKKLSCRR